MEKSYESGGMDSSDEGSESADHGHADYHAKSKEVNDEIAREVGKKLRMEQSEALRADTEK